MRQTTQTEAWARDGHRGPALELEWRLVGDRLTRRWAAVPGDEPATDLGLSEAA